MSYDMVKLKSYSFHTFLKSFGQSVKRFPLAMLLTLFLTCFLIFLSHDGDLGGDMNFMFVFYPATGALLAVALSLLTEDFKNRAIAIVTQVVVHAAWLGISVYLAQIDSFSLTQIIAVAATVFAIGLSVFLICFYRKNQDLQFWNFSIRTAGSLAVSVVIGGALALGLLLLAESLKMLFGIEFQDAVYGDIWACCMCLLAPIMFMILIPLGENKYLNEAPGYSRFTQGVVQYLFLPLLAMYLITLYVYAAKILFQWSLPVGGVSYLVSGSMVLMLLLIYVTYPVQHQEGNKLFKRLTSWMPVVMLPLLALMSVAIGRRLSDYGITVSRLYLLVFNVWCYAVCLWLIFTCNRRIWLIPASFAVILFLISVGPQSIANITQHQLLNEARAAFTSSGFNRLPLSSEQYKQWLEKSDPKVAQAIDSKLDYLLRDYGPESILSVVDSDTAVGDCSNDDSDYYDNQTDVKYSNHNLITNVSIPKGYSRCSAVHRTSCTYDIEGETILIDLDESKFSEKYHFEIDLKQLAKFNEGGTYEPKELLWVANEHALLMFDEFDVTASSEGDSGYSSVDFYWSGILFTK